METVELIGSTLGLGFLAGIRLYATVFLLGLAIRYGWFHPGAGGAELQILAHPAVLIASGLACLVEFFADKVPWVDSLWDSFHAFIRPVGAVLLAAAALGSFDPVVKAVLIVLCGGVALASTSSKSATRLAVNHSPEPFSNIGISLAEDALIPVGLWVTVRHPEVAAGLVAVFLALFAWLGPKIYRSIRLRWVAIWAWLGGRGHSWRDGGVTTGPPRVNPGAAEAIQTLARNAGPIPEPHNGWAKRALGADAQMRGIRAAATKSVKGLGNSVGYLALGQDELVFVTRRWFRNRVHRVRWDEILSAEWKPGLLMRRLALTTPRGEREFCVFRDVELPGSLFAARSARPLAGSA